MDGWMDGRIGIACEGVFAGGFTYMPLIHDTSQAAILEHLSMKLGFLHCKYQSRPDA